MANITVKRANVLLTIPDYQKDEYLAKGFDVLGANGKVIEKTIPNDVNSLKKAYHELTEKVKKLEEENKRLKAKLAVKPEKVDEEPEEEEQTPEPEEPRRRRRRQ